MRVCWKVVTDKCTMLISWLLMHLLWLLVLLSLQVLNSGGEILQKLHLSCQKLLHCWIWWWRWCLVLLIDSMSTPCAWNVLSSSCLGVYHLIVRGMSFRWEDWTDEADKAEEKQDMNPKQVLTLKKQNKIKQALVHTTSINTSHVLTRSVLMRQT